MNEQLKKIILENPELPVLIVTGKNAHRGIFNYEVCENAEVEIGRVTRTRRGRETGETEERIFASKSELREWLKEQEKNPQRVEEMMENYKWESVIFAFVGK